VKGHRVRTGALSRRLGRAAVGAYATLALAFLLLPIAVIAPMSLSSQPYLEFPPPGWTLHWYRDLGEQPRWLIATVNSLCIAVPTMLLSVGLGTLGALAIRGIGQRWVQPVTLLMLAPMMLPHVIIAIGLYPTLVDVHLQGSYAAVIIGHTVIGVPLVFLTVSASLASVPPSLELAARTLGAGAWQAFRRVTLPMIRIGIASGGLLAFATSFDELMLSLFLTGPGTETLPRLIWDQLSFALTPTLAAVATLILALSVILLGTATVIGVGGARRAVRAR